MNIMFLIFSFNIGGIERQLVEMCNAMAKDHHVWLCVINRDYMESLFAKLSEDVRVVLLNKEPGHSGMLPYMRKLFSIVRREHIQILHCQGINCVIFSAFVRLLCPKVRILNTVHDIGNYSSYSAGKIFAQNRICDMSIAITHSVEEEILARAVPKKKVTTIYNAINTEKFRYQPESTARRTAGEIKICNVARFFPKKKGQDLLIGALKKIHEQDPGLSFHCIFAGDPAAGQETVLQQFKKEIHEDGLDSFFSFTGNVDDIPSLLKDQDIFVLPSRYEGFGISLVEAMAAGLPCIASDLDGPAEIMRKAEDLSALENNDSPLYHKTPVGILFKPGDTDALAAALRDVIENLDDYDKQMISDYARSTYSMDHLVNQHIALYNTLLGIAP